MKGRKARAEARPEGMQVREAANIVAFRQGKDAPNAGQRHAHPKASPDARVAARAGQYRAQRPHRMGAGLAMLVGVVGAQTYGNQPSSIPADKNAPQNVQAQPSTPPDQTSTDPASRLPANKDATPNKQSQTESAPKSTDKMSGQTNAQAKASSQENRKMSVAKSTKPAHHAAKPRGQPEQTAMQGEKSYREALRQCAKEQDQNARDSCLDSAIEQFHRNT